MKRYILFLVVCIAFAACFSEILSAQEMCAVLMDGYYHNPQNVHFVALVYNGSTHNYEFHVQWKQTIGVDPPCEWYVILPLPKEGKVIGVRANEQLNGYVQAYIYYADGSAYYVTGRSIGSTCNLNPGWRTAYDFGFNCNLEISTEPSSWGGIKDQFK